ncbi:hypothetical protein K7472_07415 [Streptomyces sp. PTM05]|uniref:A-factor biosynthesis hotdog domain-containing protein n=1 Tax=Streptantibioticus parmotrematis TaxID=2873249 RepID=A0ABS7QS75_9ACTN|nr:ScbA/BarX family gamma-butyrolactone biosynthesis protein [Streptantibioticus parmotrematis]MBY8884672.1 hypothetical protein [Streptantibioticus parmotrematis]
MQPSGVTAVEIPSPREPHADDAEPPAGGPPSAYAGPVRLTTTVPRQYVHRAAVSEVLLTGWETDGDAGFLVTAQWPRGHALFRPRFGQQDPLLIAETIRQGGMLLNHVAFGVPLGYQFLLHDLTYASMPGALAVEPVPSELTVRFTYRDVVRRGKQLSSMRYHAELWMGRRRVATGTTSFKSTSPAVYQRIRGDRPVTTSEPPPPGVDPAVVGRVDPADVVLSARDAGTSHRWQVRADTEHPVFFDHPTDHIPGMVLLEAARQATQAALWPAPVQAAELTIDFARYAELNAPCWVEAEPAGTAADGSVPVLVTGHQEGQTVFTARVTAQPLT